MGVTQFHSSSMGTRLLKYGHILPTEQRNLKLKASDWLTLCQNEPTRPEVRPSQKPGFWEELYDFVFIVRHYHNL